MAERRSRSLSFEQRVQDKDILEKRGQFFKKILPLVREIISEDGYMQDTLRGLIPSQKEAIIGMFADYTAVVEFGITSAETYYVITYKSGSKQVIDPVHNRYSRQLHKVGIKDASEYLAMQQTIRESIMIATHMDPLFDVVRS